jgi:hypothetical protein
LIRCTQHPAPSSRGMIRTTYQFAQAPFPEQHFDVSDRHLEELRVFSVQGFRICAEASDRILSFSLGHQPSSSFPRRVERRVWVPRSVRDAPALTLPSPPARRRAIIASAKSRSSSSSSDARSTRCWRRASRRRSGGRAILSSSDRGPIHSLLRIPPLRTRLRTDETRRALSSPRRPACVARVLLTRASAPRPSSRSRARAASLHSSVEK